MPLYNSYYKSLNEEIILSDWNRVQYLRRAANRNRTAIDLWLSHLYHASYWIRLSERKSISACGKNNLLTNYQYGFKKGRSCVTQLLKVLDYWTEILDPVCVCGGGVDCICFDFSKAFDSVPHRSLLIKLKAYRLTNTLYAWIIDFLTSRNQRMSVNGAFSSLTEVLSGIPQGSVLWQLLYILFANNMPEVVHGYIQMLAYDTMVYL